MYARIGGALYLIIIVAGILGELFIRGRIIVSGDAAATAHNIMASQSLWRVGIAGDLVMHVCDVPLMLIFYVLLRPVSKNLALMAVLFNLIQTAVMVANEIVLLVPLFLLGGAEYLKSVDPHQLQALAYVALKVNDYGFGVGLIFFGFECIILGYLIFRSGYLPRALGVLMPLAGLSYLTNSFALLLAPALAAKLLPAILLPAFVAETSLCLWLLVKGVNVPRWRERVTLLPKPAYSA
ncbi:MAG TPA: DUF4386 domain-containing protein [Thermoanaerobaculia bacterium]